MNQSKEADFILGNLVSAVNLLQTCPEFIQLIPEVRVNLVYALSDARTPQDVAAIDGRITVVRGLPHAAGMPAWGASDHLARRILEIRKYDTQVNAVINFKCNQKIIDVVQRYCSERNLLFGWIDRSEEPKGVSGQDGASMPWKVKQLFKKYSAIPRLSYEGTGWGKEPLFLALGRDAIEVVIIAIEIARRYRAGTGL
ncbi:MAG: thiamine-phosphate synthase family protein [Candidatus Omnitrophica bacterium]|nr:thiamine-phosphate synthase family protein [Candidatus Omnitrophota bacterium]